MKLDLKGALEAPCLHVCVDMQRLFAEETVWLTPGLWDILPAVEALCEHAPERTVFTRFVTPRRAQDASGDWQRYYRRWPMVTLEEMSAAMIDLVPALERFVPPALVADKTTYSAFGSGDFSGIARELGARTLIVTGVETDVCVLGTVMDAIDGGYSVVLVTDAVASSKRESHDAMLEHLYPRFDAQVICATAGDLLSRWRP